MDSWCWITMDNLTEYSTLNATVTQEEAHRLCALQGASLVRPTPENIDFYLMYVASIAAAVWSDFYVDDSTMSVASRSGADVHINYTSWSVTQANVPRGSACLMLTSDDPQEVVHVVNCTTALALPLCERYGGPKGEWLSSASSPLEFGYFSLEATWENAQIVCRSFGAYLAYVPTDLSTQEVVQTVLKNATMVWVGYFARITPTSVVGWDSSFVYTPDATPPESMGCMVYFPNSTHLMADCTQRVPFLCSRYANLNNASQVCESASKPVIYERTYANDSERYVGMTLSRGIAFCASRYGAVSRFRELAFVTSCLGSGKPAASTAFLSSFQTNATDWWWADGVQTDLRDDTPFQTVVPSGARNYFLNLSVPQELSLSMSGPIVCEYDTTLPVNFTLSTSLDAVFGDACFVNVTAFILRPLASGQVARLCLHPADAASFNPSPSCLEWEDDHNAMKAISLVQNSVPSSATLRFVPSCTPSSICPIDPLLNVTFVYVSSVQLMIEDDRGMASPMTSQPKTSPLSAGSVFRFAVIVPVSLMTNTLIELKVDSSDCVVEPAVYNALSGQGTTQRVPLAVACMGGVNGSLVSVFVNVVPETDHGCHLAAFAQPGQWFPLWRFTLVADKQISIVTKPFFSFGDSIFLTVTSSANPTSALRMAQPWVCLKIQSIVEPVGVAVENALQQVCFPSRDGSLSQNITFAIVEYSTLDSFTANLVLVGPSSKQYVPTSPVRLTMVQRVVSVGDLPVRIYGEDTIHVSAGIAVVVPTGYSLTLRLAWSNVTSCAVPPLPTEWTFSGTVTDLTQSWPLNCPDTTVHLTASVVGDSHIQNVVRVAPFLDTMRITGLLTMVVVNWTTELFMNQDEYASLSLPDFGDTTFPPFQVEVGVEGATAQVPLEVTPSLLNFSMAETSQTLRIRPLFASRGARVKFTLLDGGRYFKAPPSASVNVYNQSAVSCSLETRRAYFAGVSYYMSVSIETLPQKAGAQLVVGCVSTAEIQCESVGFERSRGFTFGSFSLVFLNASRTSQVISLYMQGAATREFTLLATSIVAANIRRQLVVSVEVPPYIMYDPYETTFSLVKFSISDVPTLSSTVGAHVVCEAALSLQATSATWRAGEQGVRSINISANLVPPLNTSTILVTTTAESLGLSSNEVSPLVLPSNNITLTIRQKTSVTTSFVEYSAVQLQVGISGTGTISIAKSPSAESGSLSIELGGEAASGRYVELVPSSITFIPNSTTTATVTLKAVRATSRPMIARLVYSGPAAWEFSAVAVDFAVVIDPANELSFDIPNFIVASSDPVPCSIRAAKPRNNDVLYVNFNSTNGTVAFSPPSITWFANASSSSTVSATILLRASAINQSEVVVWIWADVSGTALEYTSFSRTLAVRRPTLIAIEVPQQKNYAGQSTGVVIDIQRALSPGDYLTIEPRIIMSNCTTQCNVTCNFTAQLVFNESTPTRQNISLLTSSSLLCVASFRMISLTYSFSSLVVEGSYMKPDPSGIVVHVRPRRFIRVNELPDLFFEGSPTVIKIQVEELPSPGTQLIVEELEYGVGSPALWEDGITSTVLQLQVALTVSVPYISLSLASIPASEKSLYIPPQRLAVNVIAKLGLTTGTLRSVQVIGAVNNQTVVVTLTRAPLQPCQVTPMFDSSYASMLSFFPPVLTWVAGETTLTKSFVVRGDILAEAQDVRCVLTGVLSDEILSPNTYLMATSLLIVERYHVHLQGSNDRLYMGTANAKTVTVTLSSVASKPVVLELQYGDPSCVSFSQSVIRYTPLSPTISWPIVIVGLKSCVSGEDLRVLLREGEEFNSVVADQLTFAVYPLLNVSLVFDLEEATSGTIQTDTNYTGRVEINNVDQNLAPDFTVLVNASQSASAVAILSSQVFVFRSLSHVTFLPMSLICVAEADFVLTLTVRMPAVPQFARSYNVTLIVKKSVDVEVTNFPTEVLLGDRNKASFQLRPKTAPRETDTLALVVVASDNCKDALVFESGSLEFNSRFANYTTVTMEARQVISDSCLITILNKLVSTVLPSSSVYYQRSVRLVAAPTVELAAAHLEQRQLPITNRSVTIPFRDLTSQSATILRVVVSSLYLNSSLQYSIPKGKKEAAIRITSNVAPGDEPLDVIYALEQKPELVSFEVVDWPERSAKNVSITFGPFSSYVLLLVGETITLNFTRLAFINGASPSNDADSIKIHLEKYTPSIITDSDRELVRGTTLAALLFGVYFAPSLAFEGGKTLAVLELFDCPSSDWNAWQDASYRFPLLTPLPVPLYIGSTSDLGGWYGNMLLTGGGILLFFVLHFVVCFSVYLQRRSDSNKRVSEVFARLRFPSLTFLFVYLYTLTVVQSGGKILLYSPNTQMRLVSAFFLLLPVVLVPLIVHGVVWRNTRLHFEIDHALSKRSMFSLKRLMSASGQWKHETNATYVRKFQLLFCEARQNFAFYVLFEIGVSVVMGGAYAIQPAIARGCIARVAAVSGLFAFQITAICLWKPFNTPFWNGFYVLHSALLSIATLVLSVEMGKNIRSDSAQTSALRLVLASSFICLIAALWNTLWCWSLALKRWVKQATEERAARDEAFRKREHSFGGALNAPELQQPLRDEAEEEDVPEAAVRPAGEAVEVDVDDVEVMDPEAIKAMEAMEEFERNGNKKLSGVYKTCLRGTEVAFSPLKKKELQQRHMATVEVVEEAKGEEEMVLLQETSQPREPSTNTIQTMKWLRDFNQQEIQKIERQKQLEASRRKRVVVYEGGIP